MAKDKMNSLDFSGMELECADVTATGSFVVGGLEVGSTSSEQTLSISGTGNKEPFVVDTTLTTAGATGGRGKFKLSTEVELGAWANALKAEVDFGDAGSVTGLGSALVAEMTLGAGTDGGTYGVLELELNMPTDAVTGTASSFIYASLNGADAGTFDTSGYFLNLAGVSEANAKLFNAHTLGAANEVTHGLRCKIDGSDYYLLMATQANFVD